MSGSKTYIGETTEFAAGDKNISEVFTKYFEWLKANPGVTWDTAHVRFREGLWLSGTLPGNPRKPVTLYFASCSCDYSPDAVVRKTAELMWEAGFGREYDDLGMFTIFVRSTHGTAYHRRSA